MAQRTTPSKNGTKTEVVDPATLMPTAPPVEAASIAPTGQREIHVDNDRLVQHLQATIGQLNVQLAQAMVALNQVVEHNERLEAQLVAMQHHQANG